MLLVCLLLGIDVEFFEAEYTYIVPVMFEDFR